MLSDRSYQRARCLNWARRVRKGAGPVTALVYCMLHTCFVTCLLLVPFIITSQLLAVTQMFEHPKYHYQLEPPPKWIHIPAKNSDRVVTLSNVKHPGVHHPQIIITYLGEDYRIPNDEREFELAIKHLIAPLMRTPGIAKVTLLGKKLTESRHYKGFEFKVGYEQKKTHSEQRGVKTINETIVLLQGKEFFSFNLITSKQLYQARRQVLDDLIASLVSLSSSTDRKLRKRSKI